MPPLDKTVPFRVPKDFDFPSSFPKRTVAPSLPDWFPDLPAEPPPLEKLIKRNKAVPASIWRDRIASAMESAQSSLLLDANLGLFYAEALQLLLVRQLIRHPDVGAKSKTISRIDCITESLWDCAGSGAVRWGESRRGKVLDPSRQLVLAHNHWVRAMKGGESVPGPFPSAHRPFLDRWFRSHGKMVNKIEEICFSATVSSNTLRQCRKDWVGYGDVCTRKVGTDKDGNKLPF